MPVLSPAEMYFVGFFMGIIMTGSVWFSLYLSGGKKDGNR